MSVTTPNGVAWAGIYGVGQGRGDVEVHVIQTLRDWIIAYIADYEAEHGLPFRSVPVPPVPESFHGDLDFTRFSSDLFPEISVAVQPTGEVERLYDDGTYGSWFDIHVAAFVQVEGDQDLARGLADIYGTALQKLLPQQGAFGVNPDGTVFATRTRLQGAYSLSFPDANVRDIVQATLPLRTFIVPLVSDLEGLRIPPADPYGPPRPLPTADEVEVNLVRTDPETYAEGGSFTADAVILNGKVFPPITEYEQVDVDVPPK